MAVCRLIPCVLAFSWFAAACGWTPAPAAAEPKKPAKSRTPDKVKWREVKRIEGVSNPAWAPDGATLAVAKGNYDLLGLWDTKTWKERCTVEKDDPKGGVSQMQFSPDSKQLAVSIRRPDADGVWNAGMGDLKIYDSHDGKLRTTLEFGDDKARNVVGFIQKNTVFTMLSGSSTSINSMHRIRRWDTETWNPLEPAAVTVDSEISQWTLSPESGILATYSQDDNIRLWDLKIAKVVLQFAVDVFEFAGFEFSPDGAMLAIRRSPFVRNAGTTVHSWQIDLVDAATGRLQRRIWSPKWSMSVADRVGAGISRYFYTEFSPDGKTIATGLFAWEDGEQPTKVNRRNVKELNELTIWNVDDGTVRTRFKVKTGFRIGRIEFSADGRFFLAAEVWSIEKVTAPPGIDTASRVWPARGLKVFNAETGDQLFPGRQNAGCQLLE
jgi:WD40 repeat protein